MLRGCAAGVVNQVHVCLLGVHVANSAALLSEQLAN